MDADNPSQLIEFINSNSSSTGSVPITLSSTLTTVASLDFNTIEFPNERYATISIKSTAEEGYYHGTLNYGSESTNVIIYIEEIIDPDACQLNPTLVTYTQTIQQGVESELPKITFNPKNCVGDFSISSAYISGGITTSEGQKPVYIKSASSKDILLGINTGGLSSAPYKSTLTLSAFGETFTDVSTINIIVTGGTNPDTNFDVNNLPVCSLTSTTLNLNSTYNMVCTNILPGVSIYPIIDNDYIKGIGPGDEMTSSNFVWKFTPIQYGNTIIEAEFRYLDLPVGEPFEQEVKISSSGSVIPGTNLKLLFTPSLNLIRSGESSIIQIVDNKTGSLVTDSRLWIDAVEIESISDTFEYNFTTGEEYEIRAKAPGYDDLVKTIEIEPNEIEIIIIPETGSTSTIFNITTNPENATLKLNGNNIDNPYFSLLSPGINTIEASMSGYLTTKKNISVSQYSVIISSPSDFKKGSNQTFLLSDNSSYYTSIKASPTGFAGPNHNIALPIPSADDTLVLLNTAATLTNKTISGSSNTLTAIGNLS
ncbi:MAG: hypothetical protein ACFFKA_18620, partial [Candidatus Thorarchaeota archaeon]